MNEEKLKEMPEYVRALPKNVQDFIFDGVWQERTEEIAKKYTLNTSQSETLIDTTLLILIGLEKPENFMGIMISNLGISRLLAEQIMQDLDNRVFDYAIKMISAKDPANKESTEKQTSKPVPEVPENLPIEIPVLEEKHEILKRQEAPVSIMPKYTPAPQKPSSEPAQRPIEVPRFKAVPIEESVDDSVPTQKEPASPMANIIENKLNNVTSTKTENVQSTPVKQYVADPYREPLE